MEFDTIDIILANLYYTLKGFKKAKVNIKDLKEYITSLIYTLIFDYIDPLSDEEILRVKNMPWYKNARELAKEDTDFYEIALYIYNQI